MTDSMISPAPVLQSLLGDSSLYRTRRSNFLAAYLGQTLGIVVLVLLINYFGHKGGIPELRNVISDFAPISFAPTMDEPAGGGSGGDRSKLAASKASLPPMNMQQQFTPPEVVLNNPDPKLPEPPSIMAITEVKLPQLGQLGNPSAIVQAPPSNGTGERGGIGSDCCGGVGSTPGGGVGNDLGNVYRPGMAGVTLPRAIYDPDPSIPTRRGITSIRVRWCCFSSWMRRGSRAISVCSVRWGWGWMKRRCWRSANGASNRLRSMASQWLRRLMWK
jgi:hypothetical protein